MPDRKEIGEKLTLSNKTEQKKFSADEKNKLQSDYKKPGTFSLTVNYKTIASVITFLLFLGLLLKFAADGGSILEVIESMLWYFAWPVGAFIVGFIIKKILYL